MRQSADTDDEVMRASLVDLHETAQREGRADEYAYATVNEKFVSHTDGTAVPSATDEYDDISIGKRYSSLQYSLSTISLFC